MPSLLSAALVALLASHVIAGPIEVRGKKAFSVQQVNTGKKVKPAPALAMLNTYAKYGKMNKAPAKVKSAAAAAVQTGTVSANPEAYDESYLCPVSVGGQSLNLDFDTGSADLWVYSTLQSSSQSAGHAIYNPNDGTSKMKNGYTWDISYGDGSGAAGVVYADKVIVGAVTATSQAVEAATSVSSSFVQDTANDGLLGLAFSSINTVEPQQQTTFFDTVKASLAAPLFTATLKKGAPGSYDFGYIDSSKYTGAITYVNVNTANGFWQFPAGGYQIGTATKVTTSIGSSIADTGTTLWYLPNSLVTAYYKQIKGATNSARYGGWIFPCATTPPSLTVTIGAASFTVPGSYINYAPVTTQQCFGGIQANTGIGFSIFGDIFLKAMYVVFDQTQSAPRIGFAKQR